MTVSYLRRCQHGLYYYYSWISARRFEGLIWKAFMSGKVGFPDQDTIFSINATPLNYFAF